MAKKRMDFETERAMKKELNALISRLLYEVEAGKSDEEQAQKELAEFREHYGFKVEDFKPYQEAAFQKVQMERMQNMANMSRGEGESYNDDWPPPEPKEKK
ncbi:MAG: hypothetical protein AAF975_04630 [Spirochaetota bacterium]